LANPEPDLTITAEGFKAVTTAPVAWHEVRHVSARELRAGRGSRMVIEVALHDPMAYLARTSGTVRLAAKANHAAGYSPVYVSPSDRKVSLQDVMLAMKAHYPPLVIVD